MMMQLALYLYVLLIQEALLIQADVLCYYYNQSLVVPISCSEICCSGMPITPQDACCSSITWSTLVVPVLIVSGVCFVAVCLVYFRPLLKFCLCGYKCPCGNRSRVTSPSPASINENPTFILNNRDLPDYETVIKDSRRKDITPPPYNFVAAHPSDFGIETRVPSAPPQYRSRSNSTAVVGPTPIEL